MSQWFEKINYAVSELCRIEEIGFTHRVTPGHPVSKLPNKCYPPVFSSIPHAPCTMHHAPCYKNLFARYPSNQVEKKEKEPYTIATSVIL